MPAAIGVDGCRGGWIAAIKQPSSEIQWRFARSFRELLDTIEKDSCILVDMIIGLPNRNNPTRLCDQLARQIIRPYSSRVFNAPIHEVIASNSYAEANQSSRNLTGKGLSKQSWFLFSKICELRDVSDYQIRESHPELAFARLNGAPVAESKKTAKGRSIRLDLISRMYPEAPLAYAQGLELFPRKEVASDDLIDAMVLAAIANDPESLTPLPPISTKKAHRIWF